MCVDENYLVPALVTLTSLADALPPRDRAVVAIRVITADLTPARATTMAAIVRRLGFASFDVRWEAPEHRIRYGDHITPTTYLRFSFTPDFVGQPHLAYLDADVLVLGDVAAPFDQLSDGQVGLVRDTLHHTVGFGFALPGVVQRWPQLRGRPYYNAGMLWCAADVLPGLRSYVDRVMARDRRHIFFNDQDALNLWALRHGTDVRPVSHAYNTFELDRFREEGDWIDDWVDPGAGGVTPAVLHFIGPTKPWYPDCPGTEGVQLYRGYLRSATGLLRRSGDLTADLVPPSIPAAAWSAP
jgi:lipopolysaccharide biosynthesis glycosyltransferase